MAQKKRHANLATAENAAAAGASAYSAEMQVRVRELVSARSRQVRSVPAPVHAWTYGRYMVRWGAVRGSRQ